MREGVELTITETPEFRYSRNRLEICKLREENAHFIAFGNLAVDIAENVVVGNVIRVSGYNKPFSWTDREGERQVRDDFIIKAWELVH